jgi:hypothetical protein
MDLSNIEELLCASCNKSSESKSNLSNQAFWINTDEKCRHRFCNKCYQKEFSIKRQFACPRCKHIVSKQNLSQKDPDEIEVERDFTIRKKIKAIYNKTAESFSTDLEYKNYEELIEDIIFNLVNSIDIDETNKAIALYQKEHLQQIAEDQSRRQFEIDQMKEDIRLNEEMKMMREIEEQEAIMNEKVYKEERLKQLNEIQLGEREEMSATLKLPTAPTGTSKPIAPPGLELYAPSHVQATLQSRAEPKPIKFKDKITIEKFSGLELQHMHAAGGYEYINYTRRCVYLYVSIDIYRYVYMNTYIQYTCM